MFSHKINFLGTYCSSRLIQFKYHISFDCEILSILGEGDMIGIPYVIGESLVDGGRPESLEEKELSILKESKLYFVNFHYQGSNKYLIQYDVCRILLHTGDSI